MSWANSTRRSRLPADWPKIRARILKRDPICRCRGCSRCSPEGCPASSTDVDHVIPIDDHRDTNLRGLCHDCHLYKSSMEGVRARVPRKRQGERHPGLI